MGWRLRFDRRFLQQLDALAGDVRATARQRIKALAEEPRPSDAKQLDEHPGYYRLWLPRNHRLVWRVGESDAVIELLYVGIKQPSLYERLGLGRSKGSGE